MLLFLYTGVVAGRGGVHTPVLLGETQVGFSVPGELGCLQNKRNAERFWESQPATCRAAVLVPQRKEHGIPFGFEIKLGLIHRPRIAFCATPGRTGSGVPDSVPELAS